MLKLLIFILILSLSISAFGTIFIPVSITTQIKEANAIVYGEVLSKDSEYVEDGMIGTRHVIKLDKWMGIQGLEQKEIAVFSPGGTIGEKSFEVEGTAEMSVGEKVVLFLGKDGSDRFWVRNLGLGKYSAKKIGNSVVLVNQVFPFDPKMGQMKLDYFLSIAERIKEEKFQIRFKDKYEIQGLKQKEQTVQVKARTGRKIASVQGEKDEQTEAGNSTFWLVVILGLLGGVLPFWYRRSTEK